MLDQAWVFKKNGVVLWSRCVVPIKGPQEGFLGSSIVHHLIRTVLLEERAGAAQATLDKHVCKWSLSNDQPGVVFVLVYNKNVFQNLTYVDEFLRRLKEDFLATFSPATLVAALSRVNYDERFTNLLGAVEARARALRRGGNRSRKPPAMPSVGVGHAIRRGEAEGKDEDTDGGSSTEEDEEIGGDEGRRDDDTPETERTGTDEEEERVAAARRRLAARRAGAGRGKSKRGVGRATGAGVGGSGGVQVGGGAEEGAGHLRKEGGKKPTTWHDGSGRMSKSAMEALDRSKRVESLDGLAEDHQNEAALQETRATYMPAAGETPEWEKEEVALDFLDDKETSTSSSGTTSSSFFSKLFARVTGNAVLSAAEVDPIMEEMRMLLIGKNVASEIAQDICESVRTSLVGQKLPSLTSVKTVVREALERAIVRVLTPRKSTDLLRQVMAAKAEGRPYSVVFVGINGVGKSTSLSKVCYYLKQHGLGVLIAACDTFRSGAVEQLKVHARCLEVDLYDKGYHKDPAAVAKAAIKEATDKGHDVVLVDTAGRMQNKEPLMRALAKLVSDNQPDLVVFVGEALVGNDGIDQLTVFNQALANYSPPGKTHQIDGIILTKFDTVDEKVGAALSMCYKTGQPILFVGTGQKYTHLKKLNVNLILNCLFR
ncbi:hypothetical protein NSK_002280 [Nannochloropsis salina CCMP1776]|jgi:signal recognition particle receptor subunit alpha|uniref:SRP54-type proteins GTP-binding domain-containing protein n=1 Tax=Nannochloropsis salina CCMP1776 TaxID=1027361 RepID=A0A4D9D5H8_9STRA|nr:hypothetical protein NSK_002280 [Nannochloropsis salina CCMP1776]|eukprot:TFJ86626.1 hypothetical protein NSK_002280 [Nannochloropsis salina CCMP1776]